MALDPLWQSVCRELAPECAELLRPFCSALRNWADVGGFEITPLLRCIGSIHARAVRAEASAQHWEAQFSAILRRCQEQQRSLNCSQLALGAGSADLRVALTAASAERDRLLEELHLAKRASAVAEQHAASTAVRSSAHCAMATAQNQQLQDDLQHIRVGLEREIEAEKAENQRLRQALGFARAEAGANRQDSERAEQRARRAEDEVLALQSQDKRDLQLALDRERAASAELLQSERAQALREPQLRRCLTAFAELWRCAREPGFHRLRAEEAVRELAKIGLMRIDEELVQEPLRRVLGDAAAKEFAIMALGESTPTARDDAAPCVTSWLRAASDRAPKDLGGWRSKEPTAGWRRTFDAA